MGDRTWHEAWVLKEDMGKYAAVICDYPADDTDTAMGMMPDETAKLIGAETFEEEGDCYHILVLDLNGGGFEAFENAAKHKLRFVGKTGSCQGSFTGVNVWSDGSGRLNEWVADADGNGIVLHFDFGLPPDKPHFGSQLRVVEDTVVWQDGLLGEISEFLVGMGKMREILGL